MIISELDEIEGLLTNLDDVYSFLQAGLDILLKSIKEAEGFHMTIADAMVLTAITSYIKLRQMQPHMNDDELFTKLYSARFRSDAEAVIGKSVRLKAEMEA
jgi:hypothetical protein